MANPDNIPKKRFDKLLELANIMKNRRLGCKSNHKSNHAAFILTKNLDVISYGENHSRRMPDQMTIHAERQAIMNIKQDRLKYNKTYCMFVTKLSPKKGLLGESLCCTRCNLMLQQSNIKITKIYYSIENGIACCNLNDIPIHVTERDRRLCHSHKIIDKLARIKNKRH